MKHVKSFGSCINTIVRIGKFALISVSAIQCSAQKIGHAQQTQELYKHLQNLIQEIEKSLNKCQCLQANFIERRYLDDGRIIKLPGVIKLNRKYGFRYAYDKSDIYLITKSGELYWYKHSKNLLSCIPNSNLPVSFLVCGETHILGHPELSIKDIQENNNNVIIKFAYKNSCDVEICFTKIANEYYISWWKIYGKTHIHVTLSNHTSRYIEDKEITQDMGI